MRTPRRMGLEGLRVNVATVSALAGSDGVMQSAAITAAKRRPRDILHVFFPSRTAILGLRAPQWKTAEGGASAAPCHVLNAAAFTSRADPVEVGSARPWVSCPCRL